MLDWFMSIDIEFKLSLLGILITFIVSVSSLYYTIRNNKAVHYVNTITQKRIEWIYKLRDLVSKYIALTNVYENVYYNDDTTDAEEKFGIHLSECRKISTEIKLMLNPFDEKDSEIISIIDKMLNAHSDYYYETKKCKLDDNGFFINTAKMTECEKVISRNITSITPKIQIYLKSEWNRVKHESTGRIYEKEVQDFDYQELEAKYRSKDYKEKKLKRFILLCKVKLWNFISNPRNILLVVIIVLVILASFFIKIKP